MRIDTTNRLSGVGRSAAAGKAGAAVDFVPVGSSAPARIASHMPAQALTGLDSILALQAVEEPLTGKKKSVRRGKALLDTLDQVRADLLLGKVSPDSLDDMVRLLSEAREQTGSGLDSLLDDIELRVRVELAKFNRFPPL